MKPQKLLSLILSMLMLAVPLASCSKDETIETDPVTGETVTQSGKNDNGKIIAEPQILTHIFRGTALTLPEGYNVNSEITPLYDKESGNITCFCTTTIETPSEEDPEVMNYVQGKHIVTLSSDGSIVEDLLLEMEGEENSYINFGVLSGDSFIYLTSEYDQASDSNKYYIVKYSFADGSVTKSDSLQPLFTENENGRPWFYIDYIAVDNEGFIYLNSSDSEVLVLDPNFIKSFSVFSDWISGLTTAPDGTVYASGRFGNGENLCPIDKTAKAFGTPVEGLDSLDSFFFGEGYDFYYTNDDGLYGLTFADTDAGETENTSELVMSFGNSDVISDNFTILKIFDKDTFLASERDSETYQYTLSIYKKADDLDLSSVKVIEIATATGLSYMAPAHIVEYNKAHPESRIVVTDYSQYNTDEDYQAGLTKLTTEILNGIYKPDIIVESNTSELMTQMVENDLYVDLYTYIDKDDRITRDDLFGAVKNLYDDDGKLFAMTSGFTVRTLMGPKSILGDRTSWTFSELLDFATNLPEGMDLMYRMDQDTVANTLFGGNGYGAFIDAETNTAHFNSDNFIKYLEFLGSLASDTKQNTEAAYVRRLNGEIALYEPNLYSIGDWNRLQVIFNTKDFTLIGYPANEGGYGSTALPITNIMLTSFCEYPDEAWDFIKSLCAPEYDINKGMYIGMRDGFPILKSMFDVIGEDQYRMQYYYDLDGLGYSSTTYDPENPRTAEDYNKPGILVRYTEEDHAALKEFLDTQVGPRDSAGSYDEITAIVNEEISSFTSGVRSAEATADIIQSRVSIWLAEHE